MNYFNKSRLLFWMGLVFLVAGSSMIITFLALQKRGNEVRSIQENASETSSTSALCRHLQFDSKQSAEVQKIQEEFTPQSNAILQEINQNRIKLLEELTKEAPNTTFVQSIIDSISIHQKSLQQLSVKHYLALKNICTPEQCKQLSGLYFDLYGYGKGKPEHAGKQRRFRGGRGN